MLNMIKKQFKLRKDEIVLTGIVECVAFVIGMIILALFVKFDNTTDKVFELGSLVAFSMSLFAAFIMVFATFGVSFNNALCMARTRRSFMTSYTVVSLCITGAIIMIAFLFSIVEKLLYTIIYPNYTFEYNVLNRITPLIIVAVILIEVIVPIFVGTLLVRYGMKAFWIMWAFWMLGFTVLPRMIKNTYVNDNLVLGNIERKLITALGGIGLASWYAIGGIILLLMIVTIINLIRKQGVKI